MFRKIITVAAVCTLFSCASSPQPKPSPVPEAASSAPVAAEPASPSKTAAQSKAESLIRGDSPAQAAPSAPAASAAAAAPASDPAAPVITTTSEAEATPVAITPAEKTFFENYLKRLKYMVVFKEGTTLTSFQVKSIVSKANEQLLKQGYDVVQYDQLVKKMEDEKTAFEAEAGASMSLVQYIAQKLGADVYVEIECEPHSSASGGRFFAEANFSVSMYDPSTAELLGSVSYRSEKTISTTSEDEAVLNALVAGTHQFMARVVRDSTNVLRTRYANGIRYQVIIQKASDSKAVSAFRRAMRSRVREIRMGDSAADQTTMDVYLFGTTSDVQDACETAFERAPGMENAYWVYTRGKTVTFNTGN